MPGKKKRKDPNRQKKGKMVMWKFIVRYWHGFHANWIHGEYRLAEGQRYDMLVMPDQTL